MKVKIKKKEIAVVLHYHDCALDSVLRASQKLNITPAHLCVAAHRMFICMADERPDLFVKMMDDFIQRAINQGSN